MQPALICFLWACSETLPYAVTRNNYVHRRNLCSSLYRRVTFRYSFVSSSTRTLCILSMGLWLLTADSRGSRYLLCSLSGWFKSSYQGAYDVHDYVHMWWKTLEIYIPISFGKQLRSTKWNMQFVRRETQIFNSRISIILQTFFDWPMDGRIVDDRGK